jgi:DNA repair protein RecO (recombination protein O)
LLDKFTEPHAENFGLYRLLLDTLRRLMTAADVDTPLRFYEMSLLRDAGYTPELEECVVCRQRLRAVTNYWTAGGGGVVCADCRIDEAAVRPMSPNAVKLLRLLLYGRYQDVERVQVDAGLASELERALGEYVRWVLERDVRSAAFIDAVRRRRMPRVAAATAVQHDDAD